MMAAVVRDLGATPIRILDAMPMAVLFLSKRDVIAYANPAAETLLGRSASLMRGRTLSELLSEDAALVDFAKLARRQGGVVSGRNIRLASSTITPVMVDVSAAHEPEEDGLVLTLTAARKEEEDPANEVTAFVQVARMLGHEVKNPLAGIVGAAQLLSRKAKDEDQPLLSLIREEGARIQRIVDRFAAFDTFFSPRVRPTNVHEVLDSVLSLAAASFASKTRIEPNYDPSLPEIEVDPDHLHEAALNLVKNAAEAAAQASSTPRLTVSTRYRSDVRFAGWEGPRARGALEISIQDNGPGLPEGAASRVFEPFYTTKSNGAGIGLAVVAEIMSAHGGHVTLVNNPGGGALARLLFPIVRKRAVQTS